MLGFDREYQNTISDMLCNILCVGKLAFPAVDALNSSLTNRYATRIFGHYTLKIKELYTTQYIFFGPHCISNILPEQGVNTFRKTNIFMRSYKNMVLN